MEENNNATGVNVMNVYIITGGLGRMHRVTVA